MAVQCPYGVDSKKAILEDIIAIEISKDMKDVSEILNAESDDEDDEAVNEIAAAAIAKKKSENSAVQQKIFGKTIVFTETKRQAAPSLEVDHSCLVDSVAEKRSEFSAVSNL